MDPPLGFVRIRRMYNEDKAYGPVSAPCGVDLSTSVGEMTAEMKREQKRRPKPKDQSTLICGVCGDKALGYNFDAITCESCKAFFRRNALKTKSFACSFDGTCSLDTHTRKFCAGCRLRKCFDIGMKKEWILSLCDGSEARKTREEKELIYTKVVYKGVPIFLFLGCKSMKEFGGTGAAALKKVFCQTFTEFGVDIEGNDKDKLVCVCADGASVNMGHKTGAMTSLAKESPSLLVIHCSLHRFELSVKDAFKRFEHFQTIDEIMDSIYQLFKVSGKNWRLMQLIAERLEVGLRRYPKTNGTRFQSHKERGLRVLLYNYCVFLIFAENAAQTPTLVTPMMKAKIAGFHKKMLQYDFIGCVSIYREVLHHTSHVTHIMECETSLITDLTDALSECEMALNEISSREEDFSAVQPTFELQKSEDKVTVTAKASDLASNVVLSNKLSDQQTAQLETLLVTPVTHSQEFEITKVASGEKRVKTVKESLVTEISTCIQKRFENLSQNEIIQCMNLVDHTRWDCSDNSFGLESIAKLSQHFESNLSKHNFSLELAKKEFVKLKKLFSQRYPSIKNKVEFWKKVFLYHSSLFPNVLLIVNICLPVAWAQGTVERGFSAVRRLLTESRCSLTNSNLDNQLMLRLNLPIIAKFSPNAKSLVQKSVTEYLKAKKWRWGLSSSITCTPAEVSSDSSDSSSDDDSSSSDTDSSDIMCISEAEI